MSIMKKIDNLIKYSDIKILQNTYLVMNCLKKFDTYAFEHICVYLRVSTRKQSIDKKCGLPQQRQLCDKWVNSNCGKSNISYWEDIGSSYKNEKVLCGMKLMIGKLKPNTLIVISEVSRLGRSKNMVMKLLKSVLNKKSSVYSVGENLTFGIPKFSNSKFIARIVDAEKESNTLGMRISNSHSYIKNNGGYIGKPPFGYTVSRNHKNIPVLKENPEHFKFIDTMIGLADESYTYTQIANFMNTSGQMYKNKLWTGTKIKFLITKFYPEHLVKLAEEKDLASEYNFQYNNYQQESHLMELHELNNNYLTLRSGKCVLKKH